MLVLFAEKAYIEFRNLQIIVAKWLGKRPRSIRWPSSKSHWRVSLKWTASWSFCPGGSTGGVGVRGVLQHWQWASECSQLEDGGDDAELPKGTFCGAINTLMAAAENMRYWMSKNALSSIVSWLKTLFGRLKNVLFENERADLRSILVAYA